MRISTSKEKAQNIINENLDKITGAKSKSNVTFKDLFKNTFKKHTDEELDEVFYIRWWIKFNISNIILLTRL